MNKRVTRGGAALLVGVLSVGAAWNVYAGPMASARSYGVRNFMPAAGIQSARGLSFAGAYSGFNLAMPRLTSPLTGVAGLSGLRAPVAPALSPMSLKASQPTALSGLTAIPGIRQAVAVGRAAGLSGHAANLSVLPASYKVRAVPGAVKGGDRVRRLAETANLTSAATFGGAVQTMGDPKGLAKTGDAVSRAGLPFDGARVLKGFGSSVDSGVPANSARSLDSSRFASLPRPDHEQQAKIDESERRARYGDSDPAVKAYRSPTAIEAEDRFRRFNGDFRIDYADGAKYHAAYYSPFSGVHLIALTEHLIENLSWAVIRAEIAGEQTYLSKEVQSVPASAERLMWPLANKARAFAEMTNSSSRDESWATDLDHKHEGRWLMWSIYKELLDAIQDPGSIASSGFFRWLRDELAEQVMDDQAYSFSLYERYKGVYDRPDPDDRYHHLDGQPIPSSVSKISKADYTRGKNVIYGENGQGDNYSTKNLLGRFMRWFYERGNV